MGKAFAVQPANLSSIPETTWWKERATFHKLHSDCCMCTLPPIINKCAKELDAFNENNSLYGKPVYENFGIKVKWQVKS